MMNIKLETKETYDNGINRTMLFKITDKNIFLSVVDIFDDETVHKTYRLSHDKWTGNCITSINNAGKKKEQFGRRDMINSIINNIGRYISISVSEELFEYCYRK